MYKRKTLNIPVDLLNDAVKASGATTQTMAVVMGLRELVRTKRLEALMKLRASGAVRLKQKDLKKMRRR